MLAYNYWSMSVYRVSTLYFFSFGCTYNSQAVSTVKYACWLLPLPAADLPPLAGVTHPHGLRRRDSLSHLFTQPCPQSAPTFPLCPPTSTPVRLPPVSLNLQSHWTWLRSFMRYWLLWWLGMGKSLRIQNALNIVRKEIVARHFYKVCRWVIVVLHACRELRSTRRSLRPLTLVHFPIFE